MTNRNQCVTLTQEMLFSILSYNPLTGQFKWKVTRNNNCKAGSIAGTLHKKGYICLQVFGKEQKGHRLAWFYTYGVWPTDQLDHINRNRADNRLENLRDASNAQNQWNVGLRKDNTTGCPGVVWRKDTGKFDVKIQKDKERIFLGSFDRLEDAIAVRNKAAKKLFGEFARIE